jgi:hypothetical protein
MFYAEAPIADNYSKLWKGLLMKKIVTILFVIVAVGLVISGSDQARAQVTNLSINNSGLTASMVSGDTIRWAYDLPANGDTASCRFWFDADNSGTLDTTIDVPVFTFGQIDGDTTGALNGPPDMDGSANSHVLFFQRVGFWAGTFFMEFTNHGTGMTATMTVTPLVAVAHTISGTVTPPAGKSAKNIIMELNRSNNGSDLFWDDLTDSLGHFAIKMDADTSGGPWRLRIQNDPFPGAIQSPSDTVVVLVGDPSGYDFTFFQPSSKVKGIVKDENGSSLMGINVAIHSQTGSLYREAKTDNAGLFQIGLSTADLATGPWILSTNSNTGPFTTTELQGWSQISSIPPNDSVYRELTIYHVNASIRGHITVDGLPPGIPLWVVALNVDTAQAMTMSDSLTGSFFIPVSDKISSYSISLNNTPFNWQYAPVTASAWDSTVTLVISTNGVKGQPKGVPATYSLAQNYPNPWNPTTTISYGLPSESRVSLRIYNLLGELVATLADGVQPAGYRFAIWNGTNRSSGVYFYRLDAVSTGKPLKTFTQMKKMLLIK